MRQAITNALLVVISVFVALAIGEIGIRLAGIAPPEIRGFDSARGWKLKAGAVGLQRSEGHAHVTINSGGFRGPEVPAAKPAGVIRVAIVGDSFTEAMHVPYEECFTAVAERELAKCPAIGSLHNAQSSLVPHPLPQVLDFGVSGYGTGQELLTLRDQVWQYSPDVVVLAFFAGNDVSDNSDTLDTESWINGERCRPHWAIRSGALTELDEFRDDPFRNLWCRTVFTANQFVLMDYLGQPIIWLQAAFSAGSTPAATGTEPGLDDQIYRPPQTPQWREAWTVTDKLIAAINRESRAHGAKFLLVTLSTPIQLYPDPDYRAHYLKAVGGTDLFYAEHHLDELAAREGFPVLNLAAPLQAYADRTHVFLHGFSNTRMGTGHWNAMGHRLAGELIAQRLCKLLQALSE